MIAASPIAGTVSAVLANRGAVVRAGDALLELVGEHRFVIAWVPVGRWYKLEVGGSTPWRVSPLMHQARTTVQ